MNFSQQRTASTVLGLIGLLSFLIVLAALPGAFAGGGEGKEPTADAGGPYSTHEGGHVDLNGARSSGNIDSFSWTVLSLEMKGESCKLANKVGELKSKDSPTPIFDVTREFSTKCGEVYREPDKEVEMKVRLTVSGPNGSDSDVATIRISNGGGGDVIADAGGLYTMAPGSTVELDGSDSSEPEIGTDPEGIDGYSWKVTDGPGILTDSRSAKTTYLAPENTPSGSVVTVQLKVNDDDGSDTDTARVVIETSPEENHQGVRNSIEDNLHAVDKRSNPPVQPSYTFENVSLDIVLELKKGGMAHAEVLFQAGKSVYQEKFPLKSLPLRSENLEVTVSRVENTKMRIGASVQARIVENSLSPKARVGLNYLSNMPVRQINEKYGSRVEKASSKIANFLKSKAENFEPPKLENFRVTEFEWAPPVLRASVEIGLRHPRIEELDLPLYFRMSGKAENRSFLLDAFLAASPEGAGIENASFDVSLSWQKNRSCLKVKAGVWLRMENKKGMYVLGFSDFASKLPEGSLSRFKSKIKRRDVFDNLLLTVKLKTPKGLTVENAPSSPSYCKLENCRVRVWKGEKAKLALYSFLSGDSVIKVSQKMERGEREKQFPLEFLALLGAIVAVILVVAVYFFRFRARGGERN